VPLNSATAAARQRPRPAAHTCDQCVSRGGEPSGGAGAAGPRERLDHAGRLLARDSDLQEDAAERVAAQVFDSVEA